ncbi:MULTISPECIES: tRNA 2-selenouridine(34) synthase MnmH [Spirulina sp. CCY15215]|uniref:tRNA 2-selenouridine(34) synthase MnmH n=1 Tax=Spirulina sp. CCY15215 TaxID=2767591 RepID=UPI00194FEB29|nr:tRNA 2-selenouridine(34) synthase MnmH [Spirulina major]
MRSPLLRKEPWLETYSEIIDVRSEGEYAEDRIPNAINLPVLNNKERAQIGTIYKQISPFEARKIGASLIAQNIAHHLSSHFADKKEDYCPLIYCWRGGQRSHSLALVLRQIGWQVTVLDGGYQTYRNYVCKQLETLLQQFNYNVLCGLTGTGKTQILQRMLQQGMQVLDLEKLAQHRGSLLGQAWENKLASQPSQKYFESLLLQQLQQCDRQKTIWIESESHKIGRIYLPQGLWEKMKQSPCIEIRLPLEERVTGLLQQYPHFIEHPDILKEKLQRLKPRYGKEKLQQWFEWCDRQQWRRLVEDLLLQHYDPAYQRSLNRLFQPAGQAIDLQDLEEQTINDTIAMLPK